MEDLKMDLDLKVFDPIRPKKRAPLVTITEEYNEMLIDIYKLINSNPEIEKVQAKQAINIKVSQVGSRKTSFDNFIDICRILEREPEHVQEFLRLEFNTQVNLSDPNGDGKKLYISSKYQQHDVENIIKKYINEYVLCKNCKSRNTYLKKDKGLLFLCCKECHGTMSVPKFK